MTPEELAETWEAYIANRDDQYALEKLFRQYESLARYFASRAIRRAPTFQDPDELISYAFDGLLKALRRYDPAAGVKFETYATRRIPGAIIDGQRQQDPLTRNVRRRVKDIAAATDAFWDARMREPTVEELAEATGETAAAVRETLVARQSLNGALEETDPDQWSATDSSEVDAQFSELRSTLVERLASLSPDDQALVRAYYRAERPLRDVSIEVGMTLDACRRGRMRLLSALAG